MPETGSSVHILMAADLFRYSLQPKNYIPGM